MLNDLDLCIPLKGEKSDKPDICRDIATTIANARYGNGIDLGT